MYVQLIVFINYVIILHIGRFLRGERLLEPHSHFCKDLAHLLLLQRLDDLSLFLLRRDSLVLAIIGYLTVDLITEIFNSLGNARLVGWVVGAWHGHGFHKANHAQVLAQ